MPNQKQDTPIFDVGKAATRKESNRAHPFHTTYDGNDNLSKVTQSDGTVTQERLFKYDSLSRLTHERQVEATPTLNDSGTKVTSGGLWTNVLKYDSHGLLTEGIDARGVKTSLVYDGLNRITSVTFTDDTPTVTYTYDQARAGFYNNGALTRVETASGNTNRPETLSTASEFDYDKMGRVVKHRQAIGTQTYELEYGYNLAGQLTSEKYPSGRTVSINYDANGRLSQIADASRIYLSNLQYQSNGGALSGMTLGNGVQQTFGYNDRLQMTQIAWSKDSNLIQRYDYAFGQINPSNNTVDTTKNNGQLAQIESYNGGTVSNPTKQFTQKFIYDSIGRLEKETEYRGDNNNQVYQQKFSYDRFGNRYLKQAENPSNQNPLLPSFIEDNNIDRPTNRLASNTNTNYDEAGNVTTDNKYRALKYFYDANGRMYKTSTSNDTNQNYAVFDASGSKVATKVNDAWRFLIYDIGGKLVAEYGGMTSADEGGVKYIHQDLQGSTRTITRTSGQVQARMDYQAFGEEIPQNIGQRTATGYGTQDSLRQKYGLTERDEATGLDDTWWRKHENRSGRWTSPDPYKGSMSLADPQSFNRYSYVENEPTNYNDPSGLQWAYYDVRRGLGCVLGNDGRFHCTEYIDRYWYWIDDGSDSGGGYGGGGNGGGGGRISDDVVKQKTQECLNELFGVEGRRSFTIAGFTPARSGSNGSFSIQGNYYQSGNSTTTQSNSLIVTDVNAYSSKELDELFKKAFPGETPRKGLAGLTIYDNENAPGFEAGRNYIANDLQGRSAGLETGLEGLIGKYRATQIHELGNSMEKVASKAVLPKGKYKDNDSGAALEECVYNKLKK